MFWPLSLYLVAIVAAWLTSEIFKGIMMCHRDKSFKISNFLRPGGMPSTHSAVMVALSTVIGLVGGVSSPIFALSLLVTVIIMTDAMQVRRATGEQGKAIDSIIDEMKMNTAKPFNANGHRPTEVLAGAIWGLVVALIVVSIMRV